MENLSVIWRIFTLKSFPSHVLGIHVRGNKGEEITCKVREKREN